MASQIELSSLPFASKPPITQRGLIGWLHQNLLNSVGNSILTMITLILLIWGATGLIHWILNAFWQPIWVNRKLFAVGPYPADQLARPWFVLLLYCLLFGLAVGRWGNILREIGIGLAAFLALLALLPFGLSIQVVLAGALALLIVGYLVGLTGFIADQALCILWILSIPFTFIVLAGSITLPLAGTWNFATPAPANLWGGLMLTLLLTVVGIALSFPLGILLALGRRSRLPVVRGFCIIYIEIVRGSPFTALLFMGIVLVPLFLPAVWPTPSPLVRVIVVITLFSAAYLAETVRGGLQAIGHGQSEAADALGFGAIDKLRLIILPQALTQAIPPLLGQFVTLFKDTALVALVGLLEVLGVAQAVIHQPEWVGIHGGITNEVYLFVGFLYFSFSYGMSVAGRRLETRLNRGQR